VTKPNSNIRLNCCRLPALERPSRRISTLRIGAYARDRSSRAAGSAALCPAGESRSHHLSALLSTSPWCRLARWATWRPGRSPRKSIRRTRYWRWLGTKTLTFEYDSKLIDRLPKATAYKVTIPAGTKSVTGGILAESVTWTFSTPPPKLVAMYPQNIPQPLEPLIFAAFDQRIDPGAVLETIQVFAGNARFDLTLATQSEIEKDEQVNQSVKNAQDGRWLVFKTTKPLPADSSVINHHRAGKHHLLKVHSLPALPNRLNSQPMRPCGSWIMV